MIPEAKHSMIILAGGKSGRMGTDKSDLLLGEQTFLQIQVEKGRQLGIEDILVSGYQGERCPVPVIKDRIAGKGPLGGLESCLRRAKHEKCLVLSVDTPLLPVEELQHLLEAGERNGASATILKHRGKEQPLVAVYSRELADAMLEEITEHHGSVFAFLNRTGYGVYDSAAPETCFLNINSPGDYEKIRG